MRFIPIGEETGAVKCFGQPSFGFERRHGEVVAKVHVRSGRLIYTLRQQNQRIGVPDATIAATAMHYHITLVTLNLSDFELVPALSLFPLDDKYLR